MAMRALSRDGSITTVWKVSGVTKTSRGGETVKAGGDGGDNGDDDEEDDENENDADNDENEAGAEEGGGRRSEEDVEEDEEDVVVVDEDEEEEEDEDGAEKEGEVPIADLINEDVSPEERQEEFLNMMKQRFVDGKDPEYGNALSEFLNNVQLDYESLALARDTVKDSDLTDAWFDEEDEAVVSPENENKKNPPSDTESEDDYMTMDLSKL